MKNSIVILCCLAIWLTPETVFSQKALISFGGELAFPVTHKNTPLGFAANAGTGFGGSLQVESSWGNHISGMASVSYLSFARSHPYSSTPTTATKVNAFPFQIGIKYYFLEKEESPKGFFISAETGMMLTTTHFTYDTHPDFDFKESPVCLAVGAGYMLGNLETGFRLQYNLGAAGFHVYYYNFRLTYAWLNIKDKKANNK